MIEKPWTTMYATPPIIHATESTAKTSVDIAPATWIAVMTER
ncbi:MAG: hypothetical protein ACODAA_06490 [Gemmatimonadota bacterium]